MERTLIARGLYGESCTSGNEALTTLRQTEFHVVIANLNMPGISGMALQGRGTHAVSTGSPRDSHRK
jgi:CheY-like chemotaxis protein